MTSSTSIARRTVVRGGLAVGAAIGASSLAGCAGLTRRVSSTSRGSSDRVTMQVYGTDVEAGVYQKLAAQFAEKNNVTVDLSAVPFADFATGIDAGLLSGTAPDVFRVDYPTMGLYASTGQLLDVSDPLAELAQDVPPALMNAVTTGKRIFGVPQHVDTSALVYRPDVLRDAGISSVPDRPEDAWSWEEFGEVADKLRDGGPEDMSPFAVNWQAAGVFRWLNWLFMAGGHLYSEDLGRAILDDEAGRRALDFTQSFFDKGWVPTSTSTKSPTYPDAQFTAGRLSMLFAGNFLVPAFAENIGNRFEYAVTYLPRDERRASEIGGNAMVATRDSANPELAAELLAYLGSREAMKQFCEASVLLPTRQSLSPEDLDFVVGGEFMPVYADQVSTIEARDVADVTTPTFAEVMVDLANELESCFLGGRSTEATLKAIAEKVDASAVLNDGTNQ